jgi:hypothetical protein
LPVPAAPANADTTISKHSVLNMGELRLRMGVRPRIAVWSGWKGSAA